MIDGLTLTLISAGILWIFKVMFERYNNEMLSLSKIERVLILDATYLKDDVEFINEWMGALKLNSPYSFQFRKLLTNIEATHQLKNLILIRKIINLFYKLDSINLDLENIYEHYWETLYKLTEISDAAIRERSVIQLNKRHLEVLEKISPNYKLIQNEISDVLANVQVFADIRSQSLIGYFMLLFVDIYPRFTENKVAVKKEELKTQFEKNTRV